MAIKIPGVDVDAGLELCDGDEDIYLRVLRSYLSAIPPALDKMRNVSTETMQNYIVNVHGVKSTSASIGAEETRKAALQLETMARSGDLSGVLAQNETFINCTAALVDSIRIFLKEHESSSLS